MTNNLPGERFTQLKDPSFRFEPVPHLSYYRDKTLWSITGALKQAGLIKTDFYTVEGRMRGTYVHSACHALDEGDLNWTVLDGEPYKSMGVAGYVRAWEKFKADWNFIPQLVELPMYASPEQNEMLFAGIPDRVGLILKGDPAIVEIKTGSMMGWTAYQTAGQDLLLRAWDEFPIYRRRFGVALQADGTYKTPVEFTDIRKFPDPQYHTNVFRAALTVSQAAGGVDRGIPPLEFAV